jgi:hypothetical protein
VSPEASEFQTTIYGYVTTEIRKHRRHEPLTCEMRSFAAAETYGFKGNFRSTFTILYRSKTVQKERKKVLRNNNYLEVTNEKAKESPTSF